MKKLLVALALLCVFVTTKPYKVCVVNEAKNTWKSIILYDRDGKTLVTVGNLNAGQQKKVDVADGVAIRFISSVHKSSKSGKDELFFTDSKLNADQAKTGQTWKFKSDDTRIGIDIDVMSGCR